MLFKGRYSFKGASLDSFQGEKRLALVDAIRGVLVVLALQEPPIAYPGVWSGLLESAGRRVTFPQAKAVAARLNQEEKDLLFRYREEYEKKESELREYWEIPGWWIELRPKIISLSLYGLSLPREQRLKGDPTNKAIAVDALRAVRTLRKKELIERPEPILTEEHKLLLSHPRKKEPGLLDAYRVTSLGAAVYEVLCKKL